MTRYIHRLSNLPILSSNNWHTWQVVILKYILAVPKKCDTFCLISSRNTQITNVDHHSCSIASIHMWQTFGKYILYTSRGNSALKVVYKIVNMTIILLNKYLNVISLSRFDIFYWKYRWKALMTGCHDKWCD